MPSLRKASLIFIGLAIVLLSACGGGNGGSTSTQTTEEESAEQPNNQWNKGNWNEIEWQ